MLRLPSGQVIAVQAALATARRFAGGRLRRDRRRRENDADGEATDNSAGRNRRPACPAAVDGAVPTRSAVLHPPALYMFG